LDKLQGLYWDLGWYCEVCGIIYRGLEIRYSCFLFCFVLQRIASRANGWGKRCIGRWFVERVVGLHSVTSGGGIWGLG